VRLRSTATAMQSPTRSPLYCRLYCCRHPHHTSTPSLEIGIMHGAARLGRPRLYRKLNRQVFALLCLLQWRDAVVGCARLCAAAAAAAAGGAGAEAGWLAVKNLEGKQTRSGKATFVVETFRSFQNFQSSQCACRWFAYSERENSRDDFGAESSVCP
jgi:hypothetical protein